jgi:hypothetical protein
MPRGVDKRSRLDCLDQHLLWTADLCEWLPQGHLSISMSEVVVALDLSAIQACSCPAGCRPRKAMAGSPLGPIREVRHFRWFLLRGKPKVTDGRRLINLRHNLLPRNLSLGFRMHRAGALRPSR